MGRESFSQVVAYVSLDCVAVNANATTIANMAFSRTRCAHTFPFLLEHDFQQNDQAALIDRRNVLSNQLCIPPR